MWQRMIKCLLLLLLLRRVYCDEGKTVAAALLVYEDEMPRAQTAEDAGIQLLEIGAYAQLRQLVMGLGPMSNLELRINAGLTYLLEGEVHVADVIFSKLGKWCDNQDSDAVLSACLAVHKNWCWALRARSNGAAFEVGRRAKNYATRRMRAALRDTLGEKEEDHLALSVYDVGIEGQVCRHESLAPGRPRCDDISNKETPVFSTNAKDLYLDLMRRSLTNYIHSDFEDEWKIMLTDVGLTKTAKQCGPGTAAMPFRTACEQPWNIAWRASGVGGLASGEIGEENERARRRYHTTLSAGDLLHLQVLVERLFADGVEGDLIETGVFRGGACIFLRALLAAHAPKESDRLVFVADSFQGIPPPRQLTIQENSGITFNEPTADWEDRFSFDQESVKYNFRRYGLLDDRVHFVPGFFNVSLPPLVADQSRRFALLRIDADAYDGVLDALHAIYPYLSPGGAVVIDDYHLSGAQAAVHFFRREHNISAPILPLPSDYLDTCTSNLRGLHRCSRQASHFPPPTVDGTAADEEDTETRRLFLDNKHLVIGIGQHGAYWRKGRE